MTTLDYIPRNQLVARLHSGWRLIPGHDYATDDYAILMALQPDVEPLPLDGVWGIMARFQCGPRPPIPNRIAGGLSRYKRSTLKKYKAVTGFDWNTLQPVEKRCSIEGCDKDHYGRGYCQKHWLRYWRHDNPLTVKVSRQPQDYCRKGGHPMSGENLIVQSNGQRRCRECRTAYMKHYNATYMCAAAK